MKIKEFLSLSDVAIEVEARDKSSLLQVLAARTAALLQLPAEAVANEIVRRDELGSTGIGCGACMPHARFREVTKPFGLLVRLKRPIAFDAIDGRPVDIVFLLLLPASSQLDQLNALAAVARKLRDTHILRNLREAAGSAALYQIITA
jgi:PTS system nitrogen regulatory IIA component